MAKLFGTDGPRGIAVTDLTCELAMQTGRAAALVLAKKDGGKTDPGAQEQDRGAARFPARHRDAGGTRRELRRTCRRSGGSPDGPGLFQNGSHPCRQAVRGRRRYPGDLKERAQIPVT